MPTSTSNTAPSFNLPRTGIASVDMEYAQTMALQSDGKVVLGGYSGSYGSYDFSVVRLNANGSLDTSFSGDGKAVIDVGGYSDQATSMVVQSDGKVVLGGYSSVSGYWHSGYSVVKLNADGSLDGSFSGDGKAVIDLGGDDDRANSVVVQSDGKVVLAGYSYSAIYIHYRDRIDNWEFSVVRLNANGNLDTSFSGGGKGVIDLDSRDNRASSVVVQSDGKVVLAGNSGSDFSVVRLNADGSLDTSFSGDGKTVIDVGGYSDVAKSMVVQSDGKVVLGGYSLNSTGSTTDYSVVRLNADGSLDSSFSGDGKAVIDLGGNSDRATSMVLQSDGKLVLAGSTGVVRLNINGSLDTTFSGDGISTAATNIHTVKVLTNGKLLLGSGSSVTRLNPDGSLDTTFGGIGANTLGGSMAYTENAAPVVLDTSVVARDAELAALNSGAGNYAGASITLARAGGASTQDVFSGNGALSLNGSNAVLSGTTVGSISNSGGTLTITFNAAATQARVNQTLSSIAYSNNSDDPPASVQIDWTFNDGNTTGSQGAGGTLSTTGRTTVNITAVAGLTKTGTAGNDTLSGGLGNDTLHGGDGIDTAVFTYAKSAYTITKTSTGLTVSSPQQGTDTLTGIERLAFPDVKVAFDLDGAAGTTAMLMGSLLGKASLQNKALVGTVLGMVDSGQTLAGLSQMVVNNGIAATLAGGTSNGSFAKLLLRNVLGSDSDGQLVGSLTGLLDAGFFSKASLLTAAAQLDANKLHIDLVGLSQTGLEFI